VKVDLSSIGARVAAGDQNPHHLFEAPRQHPSEHDLAKRFPKAAHDLWARLGLNKQIGHQAKSKFLDDVLSIHKARVPNPSRDLGSKVYLSLVREDRAEPNQWTPDRVARASIKGIWSIGQRQIALRVIGIVSGIALARLLSPADFGIYAILLFVQSFLSTFGDMGFGVSLVRQPDEPSLEEYRSIFTFQQIIALAISLLLWFFAPLIASLYHLSEEASWLFRLLAISFFLSSFMMIPWIRLERQLRFSTLSNLDFIQNCVFYFVAVFLAWRGAGAFAPAIALAVRSLVGAIATYFAYPWKIGWQLDWSLIRKHLAFGFFYQGSKFLLLIRESIASAIAGLLLGTAPVGYLNWSFGLANYPAILGQILQTTYLSTIARLHGERKALKRVVEEFMWGSSAAVAVAAVLLLIFIYPTTEIVFGHKWVVALPLFYILWPLSFFTAFSAPLGSLFNALGRSQVNLLLSLLLSGLTVAFGLPLTVLWGQLGVAIGVLISQAAYFWLYYLVRQELHIALLPSLVPWLVAILAGIPTLILERLLPPNNLPLLIGEGLFGFGLYGLTMLLLYARKLRLLWSHLKAPVS